MARIKFVVVVGNKGSVDENLTYVVKLADLENLLLGARIRVVSFT